MQGTKGTCLAPGAGAVRVWCEAAVVGALHLGWVGASHERHVQRTGWLEERMGCPFCNLDDNGRLAVVLENAVKYYEASGRKDLARQCQHRAAELTLELEGNPVP